jgi:cytidylate kinase
VARILTVDGPAGSGKTTLGVRVAIALGLPFLDTGLFYRAVTLAAARMGIAPGDTARLISLARTARIEVDTRPWAGSASPKVMIDEAPAGEELHDPAHAALLARVSSIEGVRSALLPAQRLAAAGGAVAVGRDCGTVVFPEAQLKIYLHAPEGVRETRRAAQLRDVGHTVDAELLESEVTMRDRIDSTRAAAPLQPAADAHIIDNEYLGIDEMVKRVLDLCARAGLVAA